MDYKLKQKTKKHLLIIIVSLSLVAIIVSFAYFAVDIQESIISNLNITIAESPNLTFAKGNSINLVASLDNFQKNSGDLMGDTTSTATLKADKTEISTTYNVYFKITENNFEYTTDSEETELFIVFKKNNSILSEFSDKNIKKVTIDGITGIDVTEKKGLINVSRNNSITVPEGVENITQEWIAELYLKNLATNQIENLGRVFKGEFILGEATPTLKETILIDNAIFANGEEANLKNAIYHIEGINADGEFRKPSTLNQTAQTDEGMYATKDDLGTSYYFRGAVDNNWVIFGEENGKPIYWRIIRIDGKGNIKLIYSGTKKPTESESIVLTGDSTQIKTSDYKVETPPNYYDFSKNITSIGYQKQEENLHGNGVDETNSNVKTILDYWYEVNFKSSKYEKYIADSIYCNDRKTYSAKSTNAVEILDYNTWLTKYQKTTVYFGSIFRYTTNKISLICSTNSSFKEDMFTVSNEIGNGALKYSIALITLDEIILAGGYKNDNNKFYLYTQNNYWTLSPHAVYNNGNAYVASVSESGSIGYARTDNHRGIRPVISIKADTLYTGGHGNYSNPYLIG